jgi:putative transposase
MELPKRKRPHHEVHLSDRRPTIVFLTVCTYQRRPCLANEEAHQLLRDCWMAADAWRVGRYVILPDHLHLFAAPFCNEVPLGTWVRYWKSLFRRSYSVSEFRWQSGYWDRTLRRGESYEAKWEYVRNNPVRHGLVSEASAWPFQGELFCLPWF